MKSLLLLVPVAISAALLNAPPLPHNLAGSSTYYAVDFAQPASASQFQCLAQAGYSGAFVRAYTPAGNGAYDPYACTNIHNGYQYMQMRVYMTPQPFSTKAGYVQFDEMYSGLKNNGIQVQAAFVQVVSPNVWSSNIQSNIAFIQSIITRARQYGVKPGIYTNQQDWTSITGNWAGVGADVMLWYAKVNGGGPGGETQPTFADYSQIGAWQFPTAKQFGQIESVCGISPLNRDIYVSPSPNLLSILQKQDKHPNAYIVD